MKLTLVSTHVVEITPDFDPLKNVENGTQYGNLVQKVVSDFFNPWKLKPSEIGTWRLNIYSMSESSKDSEIRETQEGKQVSEASIAHLLALSKLPDFSIQKSLWSITLLKYALFQDRGDMAARCYRAHFTGFSDDKTLEYIPVDRSNPYIHYSVYVLGVERLSPPPQELEPAPKGNEIPKHLH